MNKKIRNKDANNNPILTLIIGVALIVGAVVLYIALKNKEMDNKTLLLAIAFVLAILGAYILLYSVFRAIVLIKLKKLMNDPSAYVTKAKFVKERISGITSSTVSVAELPVQGNAYVFKKVFYEYTDESGVKRTVKSVVSYTPNQIRYLKEKEYFDIKVSGKITYIIDDIPDGDSSIEFNAFKGGFQDKN